jgi:hypothetical protein
MLAQNKHLSLTRIIQKKQGTPDFDEDLLAS